MKLIIIFIVGAAALLTGCANGPPLAVGEYQAPRYVQKPAPQPYCDRVCQTEKQSAAALQREQEQKARAAKVAARTEPAPSLPDLRRPVYVMTGAPLCQTAGDLGSIPINDISGGFCILTSRPVRVSVIVPPHTWESAVIGSYRWVRVVLHGNAMSDATAYNGVTFVRCLTNDQTKRRCSGNSKK